MIEFPNQLTITEILLKGSKVRREGVAKTEYFAPSQRNGSLEEFERLIQVAERSEHQTGVESFSSSRRQP
jgi:hypothetical protein